MIAFTYSVFFGPLQGHELAMHVLYHLHAIMISELDDCSSSAASSYEKFLLGVVSILLKFNMYCELLFLLVSCSLKIFSLALKFFICCCNGR